MSRAWERTTYGRRAHGTRDLRRVLIVCEDTKSSCDYFECFPVDPKRAEVIAVGMGMNTDSLLEEAIRLKTKAEDRRQPYNEVWCVLDRDDFPQGNYSRAFELGRKHAIKIAWANEAFELWYLLHFNFHDTAIGRHDYTAKLKPHLDYDKADKTVYDKLKPYQETALKNARKLEKHWNEMGERYPERQNPSIRVHKLVEFLNELAELD